MTVPPLDLSKAVTPAIAGCACVGGILGMLGYAWLTRRSPKVQRFNLWLAGDRWHDSRSGGTG